MLVCLHCYKNPTDGTCSRDDRRRVLPLFSMLCSSVWHYEEKDIKRRIDLASQAYGRFHSLWLRRQHVSEKRRSRLYNALVLPVLLYNCGTCGPTKAMLERLDRFHRRQLRNLIGVHYPDRQTNMVLYERCHSKPMSIIVHKRCLPLVGHITRICPQCPPSLSMSCYFSGDADEKSLTKNNF